MKRGVKKATRRGPPRAFATMPAADAILSALKFHGISDEVRGQRLITEWAELVGPKISQRTRPDGITERTLWIEVATSAWMHELNLLRPQLVRSLGERLGEPRLFDEIKFRLAGRHRRDPVTVPRPKARIVTPRSTAVPATGVAREKIVTEVAVVDDDELRELIARVRITHDK